MGGVSPWQEAIHCLRDTAEAVPQPRGDWIAWCVNGVFLHLQAHKQILKFLQNNPCVMRLIGAYYFHQVRHWVAPK